MANSIEQLTALVDSKNPYDYTWSQLEPLWIDAIDRRFQECRGHIPILDQMAERAGITAVRSLDDVVPLLFAHTVFKSYPDTFIRHNQWDRMNVWLDTLSKGSVTGVDVSNVRDADGWIEALHAAGHYVFTTSGTSGKHSFLNQNAQDVEFARRALTPTTVAPDNSRPVFVLGPRHAPNRASAFFANLADTCGRPGSVYFLTDEKMRISDFSEMAKMRKRIADGIAMPNEIAEFEQASKARAEQGQKQLQRIIGLILDHRNEPSIIVGLTPQLWTVLQAAKARGLDDGCFHPETVVFSGGGAKGLNLPENHVQQLMRFMGLGLDRFGQGYGMQEISSGAPMFEWGRYNFPPWVVPLVLDDSGERLIGKGSGIVTGRMGLFDLSLEGRWGGVVSGDRVTMDFSPSPTGRTAPAVTEIARYSELEGGDDKLTCAGTIDSFVRGAVGE